MKKQVARRYHDRKIDRGVARYNMKRAGIPKVNKKLSKLWREYSGRYQHV